LGGLGEEEYGRMWERRRKLVNLEDLFLFSSIIINQPKNEAFRGTHSTRESAHVLISSTFPKISQVDVKMWESHVHLLRRPNCTLSFRDASGSPANHHRFFWFCKQLQRSKSPRPVLDYITLCYENKKQITRASRIKMTNWSFHPRISSTSTRISPFDFKLFSLHFPRFLANPPSVTIWPFQPLSLSPVTPGGWVVPIL